VPKRCSESLKKSLQLAGLQPRVDLAGYYRFPEPVSFRYPLPSHHFLLMQSGSVQARTVDGEFTAGPRELVYFRPAPINEYSVAAGTVFYQTHLTLAPPWRDRWPLRLEHGRLLPARLALGNRFEEMRVLFETLCLELGQSGAAHELRAVAAVFKMLALIVEIASASPSASPRLDALQRARQRLEGDLALDCPIGPLARESGWSTDYFIRQFKARFGVSPKACRTRVRVREAIRLLRETSLSVKQIAAQLGWRDDGALTVHLRHLSGRNPGDIRSGKPVRNLNLPGGPLYPVNLHIVPPDAGPDWFDRWMLPGRRDAITQATAMKLSAKRNQKPQHQPRHRLS
jgi:AraC-like DNA-binding protein